MPRHLLTITDQQEKYISEHCLNLGQFLRKKLEEHIGVEKNGRKQSKTYIKS